MPSLEKRLRTGARRINALGLELIKTFEGLVLEPYRCPAGKWTIGYGHTGTVQQGQRITAAHAEALLRADLAVFERGVVELVQVPLNDNQFAALVSFAFNVGILAFSRSTLLRKLNTGDYTSVPDELLRWNKAAGIELAGLTRRRTAEGRLWERHF